MTDTNKQPIKILAVEDEPAVRLFLSRALNEMGHEVVDIVDTSAACLKVARAQPVDLVFMDININGKADGIETADIINREIGVPVIFVTAHADSATIERATRTKPYGYVVKPFTKNDLTAAIAVTMARVATDAPEATIDLGSGISYLPGKRTLKQNGEPVKLAKKELLLLHILITNYGVTVAYDEITAFVWRMDEMSNANSLRDLLYRVRKRLPGHKIISTPGVGVCLEKHG